MREPRLPRFLPETNKSIEAGKGRPKVVEERFDLRGYETSFDIGLTPELQPDSLLESMAIPPDLRGDQVREWLQAQDALLGLRHAYALLANREVQLNPHKGKNLYFFGTQFEREGRLFVPALVHPSGHWSVRLDPWDVRLGERDRVLRLQPQQNPSE